MRKGWEIKMLGDVLQKTETIDPTRNPDKEFNYIDVSSVNNRNFTIENPTLLKGKDAPSRARKWIKTNDVIFATVRPTLKRIAIIPEDFNDQVCSTGYFVLRGKSIIDNKYLFYFLLTEDFMKNMEKLQKGASYPAVTDVEVRTQYISYPKTLQEQLRIVSILDEAFEAIDQAKANTEKNLKNAKELFQSELNSIFTNKGEGWVEKSLGEIATFRNGMNFTKQSNGESIKLVGVKDFQKRFWIDLENLESVAIDGKLNDIDFLKENDILTVRSNGNPELIGRCMLAGPVAEKTSHSGFTIRIRLSSKDYFPQYLCHYLKSEKAKSELIESGTGISIRSLNQVALSSLVIPSPKMKDQQRIVNQLDILSVETKQLEENYRKKLESLEELKKSILQKAFSGELTSPERVASDNDGCNPSNKKGELTSPERV